MIEHQIEIPTKAGKVDTFICHPERGGPHPAIIFYMDAPAIREELRDMARRLATVGYYVLLPDLYYRAGGNTRFDMSALTPDSPERARMFTLMNGLTNAMIMEDTESLLAFIDQQEAAKPGPIGIVGYCMSGQFVFSAAGRFPDHAFDRGGRGTRQQYGPYSFEARRFRARLSERQNDVGDQLAGADR